MSINAFLRLLTLNNLLDRVVPCNCLCFVLTYLSHMICICIVGVYFDFVFVFLL